MCGASCRRLRRRTDAKGASSPLGHCGSRRLPHERLAVPAVRIRFARLEHELTTRLFTPAGSSPPSLGLRPRVAARASMNGVSVGYRRARTSLVTSVDAGRVARPEFERMTHTSHWLPQRTFRCAAPRALRRVRRCATYRCGRRRRLCADMQRSLSSIGHTAPSGAVPTCRHPHAIPVGRQVVDERVRPWSRRSPRACGWDVDGRCGPRASHRHAHRHLPCAAPARRGPFVVERRVVAGERTKVPPARLPLLGGREGAG